MVQISDSVWNPNYFVQISDVWFTDWNQTKHSVFRQSTKLDRFSYKGNLLCIYIKWSSFSNRTNPTDRTSEIGTCWKPNYFLFGFPNRTFGFQTFTVTSWDLLIDYAKLWFETDIIDPGPISERWKVGCKAILSITVLRSFLRQTILAWGVNFLAQIK